MYAKNTKIKPTSEIQGGGGGEIAPPADAHEREQGLYLAVAVPFKISNVTERIHVFCSCVS